MRHLNPKCTTLSAIKSSFITVGNAFFTSTNPENQWDGTYLNEAEVQQDVYVYKIIYSGYGEDQSLDKKQLVGTVTLIR